MTAPETTTGTGPVAPVQPEHPAPTPVEPAAPADAAGEAPPDREAARYRIQLREAEAARDALSARVEGYQRAEVERVAAGLLADPGDLWAVGGAELGDLLTEAGDVDPDAVSAAATALTETRPRLAVQQAPRPDPSQGARGTETPAPGDWQGFLRGPLTG